MKDIQNGTSKGYGNNLKTSNYVRNVINRWIISEFNTKRIGIPNEDYSPFIGLSRDFPSSKTKWYKIQQYDSQSKEINGNYFKEDNRRFKCLMV